MGCKVVFLSVVHCFLSGRVFTQQDRSPVRNDRKGSEAAGSHIKRCLVHVVGAHRFSFTMPVPGCPQVVSHENLTAFDYVDLSAEGFGAGFPLVFSIALECVPRLSTHGITEVGLHAVSTLHAANACWFQMRAPWLRQVVAPGRLGAVEQCGKCAGPPYLYVRRALL
jgi:hypothetical protein